MNTSKRISEPSVPAPSWKSLILKWFSLFVYSFFIVLGAVTPASRIPAIFSKFNDKLVHGIEFFLLFWVAVYALDRETKRRRFFFALIYCAALGVLTELLQSFVPSRSMDLTDFFADMAGFCLSGILFSFFCHPKKGGSLGLF